MQTTEPVASASNADRKRAATCRARLALANVVLREIEADNGRPNWIAIEGVLTRSFTDLGELEAWVDRRAGAVR